MSNLPILYKKTSTGAIQFWSIEVLTGPMPCGANQIRTEYGQLGTDSPQSTIDLISKGKNVGKKNATTVTQQAEAEALAKWIKQTKKGYIESIEAAQNEELDESIEGGIVPMLAHKFADHGCKIKYPAYISKKLDGLRIIAIIKNGKATLWSRTRKKITSMTHLVEELENHFPNQDLILDGEAFQDLYKKDFEKIVSAVRKENAEAGSEMIQYHVFDIVNDKPFNERYTQLEEIFKVNDFKNLVLVKNYVANNDQEVMDYFETFINQGHEGAMLRNADSLYVNKRSYDLQKVKEMDDSEFDIIGIEEGRGKLIGHAIFVCQTATGESFSVKMKGETAKLKEYFEDHSLWKNKQLTVQFQGFTAYGIPRFPVGLRIKEDV